MGSYELAVGVIEICTLFFVGFSALAVSKQLKEMASQSRQLRQTLQLSAKVALDGLFVPVTQAYLDYPELRAVFNPGEAAPVELGRDNMLRACALAEILADSMERTFVLKDVGLNQKDEESLVQWVEDSLRDSDFYRRWVLDHGSWYKGRLLGLAQRVQREIDHGATQDLRSTERDPPLVAQ